MTETKYKVGVLGAGLMGSQIAVLFAENGFDVVVWDIKSKEEMREIFSSADQTAKDRLCLTNDLADMKDLDFIEECLVEERNIKVRAFNSLKSVIGLNTVIGTNTSSFSVVGLMKEVPFSQNFAGVHFFNPVKALKLVEVVYTSYTSDSTKEMIADILGVLKRRLVHPEDSPGFIVNRLLIPMINEAASLLHEKIASAKEIDSAMRLGANLPMGPLALGDLIGIDVCLSIMRNINAGLGEEHYKISPLLEELVKKGHFGKKTKKGFYEYR